MAKAQSPGRPRLHDDAEILEAALRAFSDHGYVAMSVRALNAELGLSHETISGRFGSKRQLYAAALDHGVAGFFASLARERAAQPAPSSDLDDLRATIRSFISVAASHRELGRLVNQEGLTASDRLDDIVRTALEPGTRPLVDLVRRLDDAGLIRPTSARELFFLSQAAAAAFTHPALSAAFDGIDGPLDRELHIARMTNSIVRGLRPDPV